MTASQIVSRSSRSPSASPCVRVALVEDVAEMRESWRRLIEGLPGLSCIHACASGEEALMVLPTLNPEVVVMDINMPGMNGIECTAKLRKALPGLHVLMLTVGADTETLFDALAAGARGYLLKRCRPDQLRSAIFEVLAGGIPMASEVARYAVASFRKAKTNSNATSRLTAREEQLLILLSQGFVSAELAEKLTISAETLNADLKSIYDKLHSRTY